MQSDAIDAYQAWQAAPQSRGRRGGGPRQW
jgi:hypothetical protein